MINRKILKELVEKTGLSKARIYELIDDVRKRIKTYSRETAANTLAAERGIDVYSILKEEEIKEVREALKILHSTPTPIPTETRQMIGRSVIRVMQSRVIQLKGMENFDVHNLPSSVVNEASEMSYVYPIIYLFENSLRAFIKEVLDEENPN
jgi:polyhydroxyalkanoate synthesis regulator phasin